MSQLRFQFRPYARPFQRPLQTHHGLWSVRQGVLVSLSDRDGRQSWGEIAPIPEFGSEDLATAIQFCQALPAEFDAALIDQIPAALPACQFGFGAAWEQLKQDCLEGGSIETDPSVCRKGNQQSVRSSILLPTGQAALESPLLFSAQPGSTFKWKIGVGPIEQELHDLEELLSLLPPQAKLRLDANGGLNWQQASLWLQVCDAYGIEFLEQPLPPSQFELMQKLSQRYSTPIALDESVATLEQLKTCYQAGWRGLFVIKAAIAGSPQPLRQFCQTHRLDVIWSSVFETHIARQFIEDFLITPLGTQRAIGFGIDQWFNDGWERRSAQQIWKKAGQGNDER